METSSDSMETKYLYTYFSTVHVFPAAFVHSTVPASPVSH